MFFCNWFRLSFDNRFEFAAAILNFGNVAHSYLETALARPTTMTCSDQATRTKMNIERYNKRAGQSRSHSSSRSAVMFWC